MRAGFFFQVFMRTRFGPRVDMMRSCYPRRRFMSEEYHDGRLGPSLELAEASCACF